MSLSLQNKTDRSSGSGVVQQPTGSSAETAEQSTAERIQFHVVAVSVPSTVRRPGPDRKL
jgi:hypothetical protein